jgi:hypothetical protein
MNIHHAGGAYVPTPRGHVVSKKGTQPPRVRGNLKQSRHSVYAGGKILRKRTANLTRCVEGTQSGKRPDRIQNRNDAIDWGRDGFTKPGSMKG